MSQKNKLFKFAQNETFPHMFQPKLMYGSPEDFELKGRWKSDFFHNENPITVELGCGKGEYSVAMANEIPTGNFIGVDIKGARMWRGASDSLEMGMKNIAFLRTRVEFTPKCFGKDEISEIWITFPDPHLGAKSTHKKRLTSSRFLTYYQNFLTDNGIVNLKTDDDTLYEYTKQVIARNNLPLLIDTNNLYLFYTQKAMWNVFERSLPFHDLNFNPGVGLSRHIIMKNRLIGKLTVMLEHESNGRDGIHSRSWNKFSVAGEAYISPFLMAHAKFWIPIIDGEYNRDILRYSGIYQAGFQAVSSDDKWVLDMTLVKRKGWNLNFNTIVQLGYRINHNSNQFIMLQYYNGYGESLLDYNQFHSRLRIGLLIRPKFFSDF